MAIEQQDEWATEEEWVDEPIEEPVVEEPGMVGRAWDALNKPLVDLSPAANRAADYVDAPELDDTGWGARLKGFGAGAIQGLGDVVSSLTSPLELGLAAASGGSSFAAKRGLSGVAKGLAAAEGILGAGETAHGLGEVYGGAQEGNLARIGMGIAEAAGGGAGMKQGFDGFTAKPKPVAPSPESVAKIAEPTPNSDWVDIDSTVDGMVDEALNQPKPNSTNDLFTELKTKMQPQEDEASALFDRHMTGELSDNDYAIAQNELNRKYGIKGQDLPVSETVPETKITYGSPEPPPSKPKIKVRINRETNTLEPDLSDEVTAKIFNSAKTGEAVPDGQRLNPDDELDLDDILNPKESDTPNRQSAIAMANARQPELGLENPNGFYSSGESPISKREAWESEGAEQLSLLNPQFNRVPTNTPEKPVNPVIARKRLEAFLNAKQGELPGNLKEPKPDVFRPGGRPMKPQEITKTQEWLGLPRAIQSALDLSFPLRQGLGLIHTKGWWKAWPDMVRSFGSDEVYNGVMDSIAARPNFSGRVVKLKNGKEVVEQSLAQKAGLAITDIVNHREEELGSKIALQIPGIGKGIKASNRAYNAFANKLRADAFDALIAQNPKAKTDLVLAKQLADYVNNASGRGNLGKWEGAAAALNNTLFSPRLMASRMQMLNPKNYIFTRPEVRKEYLKSALFGAGTWLSLAGLAKAGGAEVVMDPENSDFGKIKIGNTRLDPAGGFQQYIVLASRLAKGGLDKAREAPGRRYSGRAFAPTPTSDVVNFIKNKMAPNTRFATGPWTANKAQPFELGDQALRTFTPIMLQDISEILQEDPELAWTLLPGLVGVGSNTYEPGKQSPTLLPKGIWNREKDFTFR